MEATKQHLFPPAIRRAATRHHWGTRLYRLTYVAGVSAAVGCLGVAAAIALGMWMEQTWPR